MEEHKNILGLTISSDCGIIKSRSEGKHSNTRKGNTMTIKFETAEHMVQILTFALNRMTDGTEYEIHDLVDEFFNQYCDLMGIDDIDDPDSLEDILTIFFADTEEIA